VGAKKLEAYGAELLRLLAAGGPADGEPAADAGFEPDVEAAFEGDLEPGFEPPFEAD